MEHLMLTRPRYFNPRSSCEERRSLGGRSLTFMLISIHAPHARSDYNRVHKSTSFNDFNPRSSCEERLQKGGNMSLFRDFNPRSSCEERRRSLRPIRNARLFQSTLLMRGATSALFRSLQAPSISIHAPHARSDLFWGGRAAAYIQFQSTLLMRGATNLQYRDD